MKFALLIFCLFFTYLTRAASLETSVVDIMEDDGDTLVKVSSGHVLRLSNKSDLTEAFHIAMLEERQIVVDFDSEYHSVQGAYLSEKNSNQIVEVAPLTKADEPPYSPTVFTTYDQIKRVHDANDNRTFDDSQCYNRAHGWAYDMHRKFGVNSMKIFLFFTDRYIRAYNHKWWFHVSPMAYVREANGTYEYVMDRSFSVSPVYTQVWTNIFLQNQPVCRSVIHYDDYRKDDPNEWCFLIRSTMYYRGTVGIKKRDRNQKWRTKWSEKELREARRQAFIHYYEYDI